MPVEEMEKAAISPSECRRSNKPIMEKRRRARINNCLDDLKMLILEALKKDPASHSKLEKADILEMTIKHLQALHRKQRHLLAAARDPTASSTFCAGFIECAAEVSQFLQHTNVPDVGVRQRLLSHLANCLNTTIQKLPSAPAQQHLVGLHGVTILSPMQQVPDQKTLLSQENATSFLVPVPTHRHRNIPFYQWDASYHNQRCDIYTTQSRVKSAPHLQCQTDIEFVDGIVHEQRLSTEVRKQPWRPW